MKIPEIQNELMHIAGQHNLPRVMELALELSRRPPISKAPPTSTPMTPMLAAQIATYHRIMPGPPTQMEIARVFNVSQGRVSEVLAGKRT